MGEGLGGYVTEECNQRSETPEIDVETSRDGVECHGGSSPRSMLVAVYYQKYSMLLRERWKALGGSSHTGVLCNLIVPITATMKNLVFLSIPEVSEVLRLSSAAEGAMS